MQVKPNAVVTHLYLPHGLMEWVPNAEVEAKLQARFPGFTRWRAAGGWRNPRTGAWVGEAVWVYRVTQTEDQYNIVEWQHVAAEMGRVLRQEVVLFDSTPTFMFEG